MTARGSACEKVDATERKCWLNGHTFVLGSHHFSSGHAGTSSEFDENIFSSQLTGSGSAAQVRILGGDLNTDPRDVKDARAVSGSDTLPAKAARMWLELGGPLDQAQAGDDAVGSRPTYAKRLSILQTQFTKAERLDVDAIDHVYVGYGSGDRTVKRRPLPTGVRQQYARASVALGLSGRSSVSGGNGLCPDVASCGYFPSMHDYRLLPNEGAHTLALSDHLPIALRVRIEK